MGCSVYCHAIIGLKVRWDQVCTGKRKVKAYKHNHPEDWEVDPKSGQPLWKEADVYIDGFDGDTIGLGDYPVVYERGYEGMYPDADVFICLAVCGSGDLMEGASPGKTVLPTAASIQEFQQRMEALGLWKPSAFKLWAFGYGQA